MAWQRNDDQYGVSRKVTRLPRKVRLAAVGLDQLAKNYSARALTDGVLDPSELEEVLATHALIRELSRVEMWHTGGHKCARCVQPPAGGIVIHDYLDYNPSRAQVEAQREAERVRKASQRDRTRTPSGTPDGREHPVPGPVPDPRQTDDGDSPKPVTEVDAREEDRSGKEFATEEAEKLRIKNLQRVRTAIKGALGEWIGWAETVDVARALLELSTDHVRWVDAYLERVCENSPDEVQAAWSRVPRPGKQVA